MSALPLSVPLPLPLPLPLPSSCPYLAIPSPIPSPIIIVIIVIIVIIIGVSLAFRAASASCRLPAADRPTNRNRPHRPDRHTLPVAKLPGSLTHASLVTHQPNFQRIMEEESYPSPTGLDSLRSIYDTLQVGIAVCSADGASLCRALWMTCCWREKNPILTQHSHRLVCLRMAGVDGDRSYTTFRRIRKRRLRPGSGPRRQDHDHDHQHRHDRGLSHRHRRLRRPHRSL